MNDIVEKLAKKLRKIYKMLIQDTFRLSSFQSIITLSSTFISILAVVLVVVAVYSTITHASINNARINNTQVVEQISTNFESYLRDMIKISRLIDESIKSNNENITDISEVTLKIRDDIVTMAVFAENGDLIVGYPNKKLKDGVDVTKQSWFANAKNDSYYFSAPHVQNLFKGEYKWVVSMSYKTSWNENGEIKSGVSLVDMNFSSFQKLCSKVGLGKQGYIYIVDQYGDIIYHPQQQLIYANIKKENTNLAVEKPDGSYIVENFGKDCIMSLKTIDYSKWKIVGINFLDELLTTKRENKIFFIFIGILAVFFVFMISIQVSALIVQPIKRLQKLMYKVEAGQLETFANVKGAYEVQELSKSFNKMTYKIHNLMKEIIENKDKLRKSELKALQAQINPHFLYNTLDSISWMAESGQNDDVVTMVNALADFFRISIRNGDNLITIEDELKHAESYLIIQEIRYKDKFDYIIEVDREAIKYKTVKIILQPIIENAIYHGIECMPDKGLIKIKVKAVDDKVLLQVIDNGLGMSKETIDRILSIEPERVSGIGVKNVNQRIQLYFGKEYGLEFKSEIERGTIVNIWLPKQK